MGSPWPRGSRRAAAAALLALGLAVLGDACGGGGGPQPGPVQAAASPTLGQARRALPRWYAFLEAMKARGYTFWDFRTYWAADKDRLPARLLVLRHDVHYHDIRYAYDAWALEQDLLGPRSATYYVMLDTPPESLEPDYATVTRRDYLDVIGFLRDRGVDVEPHVSPVDLYQYTVHPPWERKPLTELQAAFRANYRVVRDSRGSDLVVTGRDVLDLEDLQIRGLALLRDYEAAWTGATGLPVQSLSAHGSSTPMNEVVNNAVLLDLHAWIDSGAYAFDAYNTRLHHDLHYLSDNDLPDWMDHPDRIPPGRYQVLAHPRLWR